jgi:signal peptidase I
VIGSLRLNGGAHARRRHLDVGRTSAALVSVVSTVVLAVLVVVLVGLLVGTLLGYRAFSIRSGSMTPTIRVGDVVVDAPVRPLQVHPGEIVAFRDPALGQRLVTHRVVSVHRSGRRALFVTKGDANRATEHWNVPVAGHLGREVVIVPRAGRIVAILSTPLARVVAVALFAPCVAWILLRRIWRRTEVQPAA